jgi:RHH-type transcriptional regulator, proline utilization regulon repressor / proline dehydrogenase / delta 1-pyrroline-5-carboxylate dehydrogenase
MQARRSKKLAIACTQVSFGQRTSEFQAMTQAPHQFAHPIFDPMAKLLPEATALAHLIARARLPTQLEAPIERETAALAARLREGAARRLGVETFLAEFELSTAEGVALMCLAEALLRIPDKATIDALIGDKLGGADWDKHLGRADSVMVNASAWGLALTGRFLEWTGGTQGGAGDLLRRTMSRLGAPVLRRAIETAMRIMGQQFVMGETIDAALARAASAPSHHRHSFDMLGEAARTEDDAERYQASYAAAIAAIGARCKGKDPTRNPGISVKLSALHPRYEPAQRKRVMAELLPRIRSLAHDAAKAGINFTVDAEEADRLVLSLELFEALARDPALAGWDGLGLAVQAYQKRALGTVEWLVDLARVTKRRLMVRLVKGAYWDSEIKWAQERGLSDYPVFVRKPATDLSYRACAVAMLAAKDAIYGQFATHNPRTAAEIRAFAQDRDDYEFQKLHGMGDELYDTIGASARVRVYAPVGAHRDLLPYLVRRLLENGANTSFIHQIKDANIPLDEIVADPERAMAKNAVPVVRPPALFVDRKNSAGYDLADDAVRADLVAAIGAHRVDSIDEVLPVAEAVQAAAGAFPTWSQTPVGTRSEILERAADAFEANGKELIAGIVREGLRTIPDAVSELREAVDFLRYYAIDARRVCAPLALPGPTGESNTLSVSGRGVFACISPWNFPLAIFTGQIAAALAVGNTVVAKPAPQTPRIAARVVALLHAAGVPSDALISVQGGPEIGAALVADPKIAGVAFTGSTATAQAINRALAAKDGPIVPLIAETGGVNAMIADSSALTEQLVNDAIVSAFQSAGQRCSALRVLFVQEDAADRTIAMLKGAMAELELGDPGDPATDIGPVIDAAAKATLDAYLVTNRTRTLAQTKPATIVGNFVQPTLIETTLAQAPIREVFGPILHLVRWRSSDLDSVLEAISRTGYGLTFGIHSRLESFQARVRARVGAGNIYINRSIIGAVVGVQPFGGHGLSGTGPKAGGPNYLPRFACETTLSINTAAIGGDVALMARGPQG